MRAPLGAPRRLASQLNAATQAPGPCFLGRGNMPVPVQRAPRGGVIMPPGRFPGPPGSKVTSLARRHRAADVGFTRYRPNQGGSISETSREDALNEPSEWNIILEKE